MQMRIIVDAVDEVEPVSVVHATGGCFRSSLRRDVMAATIGRPLHVVDGANGTVLGAAAHGLFAMGRAATLADAAQQLGVCTTRQCHGRCRFRLDGDL
jgi:gluconokinase